MSRTKHHREQKSNRSGHDYGGKYKCNKYYNQPYGSYGRSRANSERRACGKKLIEEELIDIL